MVLKRLNRRHYLVLLITFSTVAVVSFQNFSIVSPFNPFSGLKTVRISVENQPGQFMSRKYLIATPDKPSATGKYPAIIVLHGGGGSPSAVNFQTNFAARATQEGFLAIFPAGERAPDIRPPEKWKQFIHDCKKDNMAGYSKRYQLMCHDDDRDRRIKRAKAFRKYDLLRSWNSGNKSTAEDLVGIDDVKFISAVIDDLVMKNNLDPKSVFVTGVSNGAQMTFRVACELPEKITAIAPIAGGILIDKNICLNSKPIPLIQFHGTNDPAWPYLGGPSQFLNDDNREAISITFNFWFGRNGLVSTLPKLSFFNDDPDTPQTICTSYQNQQDKFREVRFCTVQGGGHTWPGGQIFSVYPVSEENVPWITPCPTCKGVGKVSLDSDSVGEIIKFFKGFVAQ